MHQRVVASVYQQDEAAELQEALVMRKFNVMSGRVRGGMSGGRLRHLIIWI